MRDVPLPNIVLRAAHHYASEGLSEAVRTHAAAVSAAKDAEIAKLKTVMVAAAEEIQAYWDAHCDADGYGPVNLMRRLEEGIPSQYGYTAGAFEQLRADNIRLQNEVVGPLRERVKEAEAESLAFVYERNAAQERVHALAGRVKVLEDALGGLLFAEQDECTLENYAAASEAARAALGDKP